ncbi:BCNT-domain-containing protein [Ascobolus immersus RN42]|uniref:SWR1-complex protein 5 n=1 Tax=Ascobolus immersus RN42 TaxID=1160509 RepID=A0A3N4IK63_ASCIM|nr:BCNT-domain-containing protein [Ascobolus immersus RN42]
MPSDQKEDFNTTATTTQTPIEPSTNPEPPSISAILDDEDYNSDEDSDFAPGIDDDEEDGNDSDSSDDTSRQPSPKPAAASETVTLPPPSTDSSTETVTKAETTITTNEIKTKQVTKDDDGDFEADPADEPELDETIEGGVEDTGPGGEIKTRAQRAKEQEQRKAFKTTAPVKADSAVDSIWAQMKTSWRPAAASPTSESTPTPPPLATTPAAETKEETYIFAGEVVTKTTTSTKTITTTKPLTSASSSTGNKLPLRRPKRRSSAFDTDGPSQPKAKKLNTLEKSKLDWVGFTKTEGLEEELEKHGKGGKGYIERQNFLDRTGGRI